MTVKLYTQVRATRTLNAYRGNRTALRGAILQVSGYSRGWYRLVHGPAIPGYRAYFLARRRDFKIMRQKIYCNYLEMESYD